MSWILINKQGESLINTDFKSLDSMSEGYIAFESLNGWGFLDKNFKIAISPSYGGVESYGEGLFPVKRDNKWGFIDSFEKIEIPFRYDAVFGFKEGLAAANIDGKWGFINRLGQWVIQPKIDFVRSYSNNVSIGRIQTTWFCLNHKGFLLYKLNYAYVGSFCDNLCAINIGGSLLSHHFVYGGKWGFVSKNGVIAIRPTYDWVGSFEKKLAPYFVKDKNEWGFMNSLGKIVITISDIAGLRNLKNGIAAFDSGKGWGFMDQNGRVLIEPQYKEVKDFSEDVVAVELFS